MNQKQIDRIREIAGDGAVLCGESMAKHTTFRTGGPAEVLITPSMDALPELIAYLKQEAISYYVIGNGSNLLVGDLGIDGAVIEIGRQMSEIKLESVDDAGETWRMTAQAGALLSAIAAKAAASGLTGFEFAAGIPGSIGGAVVMNAGAYGGEMVQVLETVTVLTREGEIKTFPASELELSYRHSNIPETGALVMEAALLLKKGDSDAIYAYMEELRQKRVSKQPLEYPSAGSTFKRPEGHFAGKLIEDAGLRGFQVGGAQVSEKHCGFVINRSNAASADIRSLMEQVQKRVLEQFGVMLEPEVRFVGRFAPGE